MNIGSYLEKIDKIDFFGDINAEDANIDHNYYV